MEELKKDTASAHKNIQLIDLFKNIKKVQSKKEILRIIKNIERLFIMNLNIDKVTVFPDLPREQWRSYRHDLEEK